MRHILYFIALTFAITAWCDESQGPPNYSNPVKPAVYARYLKQGFSTNYFKSSMKGENGTPDIPTPAKQYKPQNIVDIHEKGFRNLRIRVRADLYVPPYDDDNFETFLEELVKVVKQCIKVGVAPIISWIHHEAEAFATTEDRENYLTWWEKVATRLKNMNYHLSFNLFTELGVDECEDDCSESLREDTAKYNDWTRAVIKTIRGTKGKNRERILILASPKKTSSGLDLIDKSILDEDEYLMVEWHEYAAGPYNRKGCSNNKKKGCRRNWKGKGNKMQRGILKSIIKEAKDFTKDTKTKVPTYFGAWMPRDNGEGTLRQQEVINFGQFFAKETKKDDIPWSLNVLDDYYQTNESRWITGKHDYSGAKLDLEKVLDSIIKVM